MPESRRVKAGVVGCGDISLHGYFPYVSRIFDLVATCDLIEDRASQMARIWGASEHYASMDDMLAHADIEAVFVLTSMASHADVSLKAVEAGKHFLVQKPFATDLEKGLAVVEAARQKGLKGLVEPNYWLDPVYSKAREILDEGHIGTVHYAKARNERGFIPLWGGSTFYERAGGGGLFDVGVYEISGLTRLLGPAKKVAGMATISIPDRPLKWPDDVFTDFLKGFQAGDSPFAYRNAEGTVSADLDVFDNTLTLIEWPNECLGCLPCNAVSTVLPPATPRIVLCGEKGTLAFGVPGSESRLSVATIDKESPYHVPARRGGRGVGWFHFPGNFFPEWRYMEGSTQHLHDCILNDTDPVASIEWGTHVAEIMIKSYESAEQDRFLELITTF
jgi:predicted dehydrogenase